MAGRRPLRSEVFLETGAATPLDSFQVEICTGAVFMRLVLGLDVYLASVVLLSVDIYSITGEVLEPHRCLY